MCPHKALPRSGYREKHPARRVGDAEGALESGASYRIEIIRAPLFIRRRFAIARPFTALRTRRSSKSGGGSRDTFRAHFSRGGYPGLKPRLRKAYVAANYPRSSRRLNLVAKRGTSEAGIKMQKSQLNFYCLPRLVVKSPLGALRVCHFSGSQLSQQGKTRPESRKLRSKSRPASRR
jgi:hypothetical protein